MEIETNTQTPPTTQHQVDEVSEALKAYKADEKTGKVIIPDGAPAYVVTALKLEQRRRDANSTMGREKSRADKLAAENEALKAQMQELVAPSGLTAQQAQELEELKFTDPDAWFEKKLAYENLNKTQASERVTNALQTASQTAESIYQESVTKSRDEAFSSLLAEHNAANPDRPITKEMMNLNVPPILVNKFQSGELTGPELLEQVSKYVYSGRTVHREDVIGQPNLTDATGGTAPTDQSKQASLEEIYAGI